ncbi:MAG: phosphodiester glycosidase family protein [Verrucomicrobiota bacterium]|nr:phosphodiester glycosidase family protein [Verrucomicrobiota bacterium]
MRKLSAALLILLVAAPATRADWKLTATETDSAYTGLQHRHVVLENPASGDRVTVELALFDPKQCTLRVIDNAEGKDSLSHAMQREGSVAGVNGGYFDPNFAPIGLRIVDGKTTAPLQRARLLTGVLISSPRGIEMVRVGEFSRRGKFDAAVECGPFLVDLGLRVRGLDDTRSARRTFAAAARGGRAALGYCTEVSLAQLAEILSSVSLAENFKIWRAMNLDGGSSSGFWFAKDGEPFSIAEQKTVRDFVAIVPR